MKDRIKYIDNLRIYAILCIILLHVTGIYFYVYHGVNTAKLSFYIFLSALTRVGVPIFFMLTGILMFSKKEEDYKTYLKTRVKRLVLAYGFFSILYYMYHVLIDHIHFSVFDLIRQMTSYQTEYHLWFMPVIIVIYIFLPFIRMLIKHIKREDLKKLIIVIFVLSNGLKAIESVTAMFGYSLMSSFVLPDLIGYTNYLLIGYYLDNGKYTIHKKLIIITVLSILSMIPATLFVSRNEINTTFMNSLSIFVLAPSILVFLLFKNSKKSFPERISTWISRNANQVFYVYLIHILFLNIILKIMPSLFESKSIWLELLIIIMVWIIVTALSFGFAKIWTLIKSGCIKYSTKIKNVSLKLLSIGFIAFFTLVLINLIINPYHFIKMNYLLVLIGIIIWIVLYLLWKKFQDHLFNDKYYNIGLGILFVLIQILIGYAFMVNPTWDFGRVYEIVVAFAKSTHPIFGAPYLYMCENNIPITIMFDLIFKCFYTLGVKNHLLETGIFINIIMIDISLIYTYLLVSKINKNSGKPFLFFLLLSSPLLFYIPIFYTDTISLPFGIITIYYGYKYLFESQKTRYLLIAGISMGIGYLLKPTVLIIGIAMIIFLMLKKKKINYYQFVSLLFLPVIVLILGQKVFVNHFFDQESLELYKIPKTHYILIGLENNGEYSDKRLEDINKEVGQENRKKMVQNNIKKRIKEMIEKKEVLSFYNRKIAFTWTDGTFFAFEKLHREPIHPELTKNIYSNENNDILYWTFSNSEWIIIIVLMILGVVFRKYLPDKIQELGIIINISIVGIILFLLIWETRSRYLVNFVPLFLVDAYIGLYALERFINTKKEGRQ